MVINFHNKNAKVNFASLMAVNTVARKYPELYSQAWVIVRNNTKQINAETLHTLAVLKTL